MVKEITTNEELIAEYKKNNDAELKKQIMENNLGLVHTCVKKFNTSGQGYANYKRGSFTVDDLLSMGCIGLSNAIETFNCEKGFLFSSYAYRVITNYLHREVQALSYMVKIPEYIRYSDNASDRTKKLVRAISSVASLDENFTINDDSQEDEGEYYGSFQIPYNVDFDESLKREAFRETLVKLLDSEMPSGKNKKRNKAIILKVFGLYDNREPLSYKEVGEEYNISKQRVEKIVKTFISKCRNNNALKDLYEKWQEI